MKPSLCTLLSLGILTQAGSLVASDAPIWLTTSYTYTVPAGQSVTLRAIADGAAPLHYFWLSNGIPIPNLSTNTLTVIADTKTANCPFCAVATNAFGTITNEPFFVKVLDGTAAFRLWGDVLGSGQLNVLDVLGIGKHISGATPLTGTAKGLADVNQDGAVNVTDQNLVKDAILGRVNLGSVNEAAVRMDDGTSDATELRDGADPLDPRSLVPYGWYSATPPLTVFASTFDTVNAAVFVASPPVTVFASTLDTANAAVFVASPPVTVFVSTFDAANAAVFVASPPVNVFTSTFDTANAGVFAASPPVTVYVSRP